MPAILRSKNVIEVHATILKQETSRLKFAVYYFIQISTGNIQSMRAKIV